MNALPGRRVLEVGVGTGLALPRYRTEKRVVGIDLSREMLLKAEERVRDERLAHVEGLLEMDAESMAFQDGAFDIAVAMFTASGPGVDSDTAIKLRNSLSVSQPCPSTVSRTSEIMP